MSIPTAEEVLAATAKHLGVPVEVITDPKYRTSQVCQARGIAAVIARKITFLSYGQLESPFDLGKWTIAAAARKVERDMKKDPELQSKIKTITDEVASAHTQTKRK